MAVDRNRIAAALAYRQAEEERRRRMMESVPTPGLIQAAPASRNLRRDLENLSIGIGEGLVNQLEGIKGIVTDPVGSAKGAYEAVRGVVRDPSVLADALRYTAQKASRGPLGAGEVIGEMVSPMRGKAPVMSEIDVYHGSPHRFEEFDASKIGTGEGAQAYGHGIYLAESPDVARGYQNQLAYDPDKIKIGGRPINDVYKQMENTAARMPPAKAAAEYEKLDLIERLMQNNSIQKTAEAAAELSPATQEWFEKKIKPNFETYGAFYKADLPDEMVDRMLDYDLPINQQNPYVLAALDRAGINTQSTALAGPMAQGQEGHLAKFGIPGIKYMDEGSRGYVVDLFHKGKPYAQHEGVKHATLQSAQERIAQATAEGFEPRLGTRGTRNFVVFPGEEKKVTILERNGKKLANALKATAAQKQDVEVNLYPVRNQPNVLYLSKIEVPQGQRGQGIGSSVMQDIIAKADEEGKTITLTPSTAYGATSTKRLKDFYKRFGFVENSGRNKNYALNESMYRLPQKPKE